ncbi:hypothetical protein EVAR_63372_1 [Eumeta japonica]|uniref:Uncharacterized protein n=1 Tax=Eumeta variegata TaxID=151549 RepID=A0A4C1ZYJ7_EUMVA|nr:hypothetical protein EVAR_63372_1 [Eumeta japonica]
MSLPVCTRRISHDTQDESRLKRNNSPSNLVGLGPPARNGRVRVHSLFVVAYIARGPGFRSCSPPSPLHTVFAERAVRRRRPIHDRQTRIRTNDNVPKRKKPTLVHEALALLKHWEKLKTKPEPKLSTRPELVPKA